MSAWSLNHVFALGSSGIWAKYTQRQLEMWMAIIDIRKKKKIFSNFFPKLNIDANCLNKALFYFRTFMILISLVSLRNL